VIDAGSKSLAYDPVAGDLSLGHGLVMGTELVVKSLSEEHGVIEMPAASDWPRVGERLRIIPNHVCVISNLFDKVTLISGDEVKDTLPVASRGRTD
jgi:D-serine deaminase-like pyridoxal phosphate-dependent protein